MMAMSLSEGGLRGVVAPPRPYGDRGGRAASTAPPPLAAGVTSIAGVANALAAGVGPLTAGVVPDAAGVASGPSRVGGTIESLALVAVEYAEEGVGESKSSRAVGEARSRAAAAAAG